LPSTTQWDALVKINLQYAAAVLSTNPDLKQALVNKTLMIHAAIYDVSTGLLNFLKADDKLPATDPVQPIQLGTFLSQNNGPPITNMAPWTKTVSLTQSYKTPPRVVLGIYAVNLDYGSRINFSASCTNVTKTTFDITLQSTSGTIEQSCFHWLEIPDELIYSNFQTGSWSISVPTSNATIQQLIHQVVFETPFLAMPTVVVLPTGFDIDGGSSFEATASQVSLTGFLVTIQTTGQKLPTAAVNWLAYPTNNAIGFASGVIGNTVTTELNRETAGYINFPYPATGGASCNAVAFINKFSVNQGNRLHMFTIMNPSSNGPTKGSYDLGRETFGTLQHIDGVFISWPPVPQSTPRQMGPVVVPN